MQVVFDASNSEQLFSALSQHSIDVLLLDVFMPGVSGKDIMRVLPAKYPSIRTIVMSHCVEEQLVNDMLELGVYGYLSKSIELDELINAIKSAYKGEIFKNDIAANSLFWKIDNAVHRSSDKRVILTETQIRLLQLLWEEKNNQEIAKEIFTSVSSIEKTKQNLKEKLGVKSTVGLIKYAIDNHIVFSAV